MGLKWWNGVCGRRFGHSSMDMAFYAVSSIQNLQHAVASSIFYSAWRCELAGRALPAPADSSASPRRAVVSKEGCIRQDVSLARSVSLHSVGKHTVVLFLTNVPKIRTVARGWRFLVAGVVLLRTELPAMFTYSTNSSAVSWEKLYQHDHRLRSGQCRNQCQRKP